MTTEERERYRALTTWLAEKILDVSEEADCEPAVSNAELHVGDWLSAQALDPQGQATGVQTRNPSGLPSCPSGRCP
jgi:hypothetical protein